MVINAALIFNLIGFCIVIAIVYLIGRWLIGFLGLGEPWPKVLALIIVLLALGALYQLFFIGPFIRLGELENCLRACALA